MNSTNHDKPSSAFLSLEPHLVGESDDTLGTVSVMAEDKDGTGAFLSDEGLPALDDATTIEYLYLTFNTPIPNPAFRADLPPSDEAPVSPTPDLVGFTNPLDWPKSRKNVIVVLSCVATFLASYATGAYSPAAPFIANELHTTTLATEVGVTTFCFGFALAPMALAPFSEVHGRYPVFAVAGVILTIFQAVCGVVTSLTGMLIARFFVGVGGSVFSTLVAGVISDVFRKEDRNTPMALFSRFYS
ncbi:major facilitator superfamily domain-containing protein [Hypoxylon argillaceum]|nr:major facilitator superfamily domain-containing protein [Hypoxylon argillaceum]